MVRWFASGLRQRMGKVNRKRALWNSRAISTRTSQNSFRIDRLGNEPGVSRNGFAVFSAAGLKLSSEMYVHQQQRRKGASVPASDGSANKIQALPQPVRHWELLAERNRLTSSWTFRYLRSRRFGPARQLW